jgi:hypothetical protein
VCLIQAAKAKARGYRSTRNPITIVYLIAGKLDLSVPTYNIREPIFYKGREHGIMDHYARDALIGPDILLIFILGNE